MLTGEPWCFTPDQVAELTDWQIEHLYARPAARRAEEMKRASNPSAGPVVSSDDAPAASGPPKRADYVEYAVRMLGMKRPDAEAQYDRQLASYLASRNGAG